MSWNSHVERGIPNPLIVVALSEWYSVNVTEHGIH